MYDASSNACIREEGSLQFRVRSPCIGVLMLKKYLGILGDGPSNLALRQANRARDVCEAVRLGAYQQPCPACGKAIGGTASCSLVFEIGYTREEHCQVSSSEIVMAGSH